MQTVITIPCCQSKHTLWSYTPMSFVGVVAGGGWMWRGCSLPVGNHMRWIRILQLPDRTYSWWHGLVWWTQKVIAASSCRNIIFIKIEFIQFSLYRGKPLLLLSEKYDAYWLEWWDSCTIVDLIVLSSPWLCAWFGTLCLQWQRSNHTTLTIPTDMVKGPKQMSKGEPISQN